MPSSGKGCMLPITGGAYFIFYKYPGGIPVKRSGGSSPGILPGQVELYDGSLRACITGSSDIGNNNVIGKKGAGNTQQRTEQEGSYGGIG